MGFKHCCVKKDRILQRGRTVKVLRLVHLTHMTKRFSRSVRDCPLNSSGVEKKDSEFNPFRQPYLTPSSLVSGQHSFPLFRSPYLTDLRILTVFVTDSGLNSSFVSPYHHLGLEGSGGPSSTYGPRYRHIYLVLKTLELLGPVQPHLGKTRLFCDFLLIKKSSCLWCFHPQNVSLRWLTEGNT